MPLNERTDCRLQSISYRCQEFFPVEFYRADRDRSHTWEEGTDRNRCNDICPPRSTHRSIDRKEVEQSNDLMNIPSLDEMSCTISC